MNINRDYKNRQIIPRLYPYKYAFYLGEIKPKIRHDLNIKPSKEYLKKEKKWLFNKSLPYAIEFVGEALILNDYNNKNSVEAAKFILKKQKYISNITKQLANEFLKNPNEIPSFNLFDIDIYKEISLLKKNIRAYSINAINWINIALYYAILGQIEKANHAIRVALNLSPYNRFILRSAARFFLHKGDSEKALSILRNTEYTKYDPWLLASEISVSQVNDTRSSNIKIARNILDHLDVSPKDLSELFGSMGTLEINSGNAKKAKKLFKKALVDPNENTTAQIAWIASNHGIEFFSHKKIEASFETDARYFFNNAEYKKALEATLGWLKFQPFSSRPAQNATYIAGTCLENFEEVIRIVKNEAKFIFNNDFIVKNNYLFSLASLDRIQDIYETLKKIIDYNSLKYDGEKSTYKATEGLINFRTGNIPEGRRLYKEAIEGFKNIKSGRGETLAKYYLAREEKRIGNDVTKMIEDVRRLVNKYGVNELKKSKLLSKNK